MPKIVRKLMAAFMACAAAALAAETVLAYDDGATDGLFAVMSDNAGQQAGMHFVVGEAERSLVKLRVFVAGGALAEVSANVRVVHLDRPGAEEVLPFRPTAIGTWNEIVVDPPIKVKGNVMVAVEWVTPTGVKEPFTSFFIGVDYGVANHNGYIKHPGGEFYPARRFGSSGAKNFHIRMVLE